MATAKTNPLPDPEDFSEEVARARALAARYRLEFVEMSEFRIDQDLFRSIPADLMLRYGFVPHRREDAKGARWSSSFRTRPTSR
jgi:type IV pilus assembly protein PilB